MRSVLLKKYISIEIYSTRTETYIGCLGYLIPSITHCKAILSMSPKQVPTATPVAIARVYLPSRYYIIIYSTQNRLDSDRLVRAIR